MIMFIPLDSGLSFAKSLEFLNSRSSGLTFSSVRGDISASCRFRSLAAAMVAFPVPVRAAVAEHARIEDGRIRIAGPWMILSKGIPRTSAVIWQKIVLEPCPISVPPWVRMTFPSSRSFNITEEPKWPPSRTPEGCDAQLKPMPLPFGPRFSALLPADPLATLLNALRKARHVDYKAVGACPVVRDSIDVPYLNLVDTEVFGHNAQHGVHAVLCQNDLLSPHRAARGPVGVGELAVILDGRAPCRGGSAKRRR